MSVVHRLAAVAGLLAAMSVDARAATAECKLDQVGAFAQRIFVRCNTASAIFMFAYPTKNPGAVARMLNLMMTVALGGPNAVLMITYEPADTSGTTIGCLPDHCRLITGVSTKE